MRNRGRISYQDPVCGTHASATISRASHLRHLSRAKSTVTPPNRKRGGETCVAVESDRYHSRGQRGNNARLTIIKMAVPITANFRTSRDPARASANPTVGLAAKNNARGGNPIAAVNSGDHCAAPAAIRNAADVHMRSGYQWLRVTEYASRAPLANTNARVAGVCAKSANGNAAAIAVSG